MEKILRNEASQKIANLFKILVAKEKLSRPRNLKLEKERKILETQNIAAKIIQKFDRGFHVRKIQLKLDPATNAKRQKLTNPKTAICEPQPTMLYRTNSSLENLKYLKEHPKQKLKSSRAN